jgi:hypothetical protein
MKWNYLSESEATMEADLVDLQIAIGLQSCKTKGDVMALLKDVRMHERNIVLDALSKGLALTKDEKEIYG